MPLLPIPTRAPRWTSHRRLLEQKLSDLHHASPSPSHLKQLHSQLLRSHLHLDPFIAPKLISSYSLCRLPASALSAFRLVPRPNTHLFNTLIRALSNNKLHLSAFSTFVDMQAASVPVDNFTYSFLLKACNELSSVEMIHSHIIKLGFLADIFVPNSLIDSYSKSVPSGITFAKVVFSEMRDKDTVTYNSMISGLVRAGHVTDAMALFDEMPERDTVTYNTMLDGLSKAGEMDLAFGMFEQMPERNVVSWSTMVSGYCKKGDMDMARVLFDRMPVKNLVTWTIMVTGYAEKGLAKEALGLFDRIQEAGLELDGAAIISILAACAESGLLSLGKRVHDYVQSTKLRFTTRVCNSLVDMYAKCGSLDKAWSVFQGMEKRDLVSWNSMVQGLAMHGHGVRALGVFCRMKEEGARPNGVTLIGVLSACAHVGLIEEGRSYFSSMERDYGITPQIEHYGCMINLLGRCGLVKEAYVLAKSMPWKPNVVILGTLLGACRVHNNVEIAEEVVDQLTTLEPSDAGNLAMLSNIYAAAGRWDGVAKMRIQMKGTCGLKPSGSSWIELNDTVHEFTVADRSHKQSDRIFRMLDKLGMHLKQVGYVPRAC